ncbi:hypothetical protein [Halobaculum roseum]|uniref:Uncharacterized protein n=1 Tax=Halobaculum roseum TaxID=2175149 RepID=A0ABD5MQ39_9EURY|nr:hypothetical protein [Halobaculum roseum]QZY04640.1 hypothetical protein K6T36_16935 [Halobaculum roseum]
MSVSCESPTAGADVQTRVHEEIPDAELFESLWIWSDTPAGWLSMVDGPRTLGSVLVNGANAAPTDPRSQTAIWGPARRTVSSSC